MGHRHFLPDDHNYGKTKQFSGKHENGHAPKTLTSEEILGRLDGLISRQRGKHLLTLCLVWPFWPFHPIYWDGNEIEKNGFKNGLELFENGL